MYLSIIILNLIVISSNAVSNTLVHFSEETGALTTDDAVIISATETKTIFNDARARNSFSAFDSTCKTSSGIIGVCTRFRDCYPGGVIHTDVFDLEVNCYDISLKIYGVCCTTKNSRLWMNSYLNTDLFPDIALNILETTGSNTNLSAFNWKPYPATGGGGLSRMGRQATNCGIKGYSRRQSNHKLPDKIDLILACAYEQEMYIEALPIGSCIILFDDLLVECSIDVREVPGSFPFMARKLMLLYGRIIGGHKAEIHSWPWMSVIMYHGYQYCGATLISNLHALTAAHCMRTLTPSDLATMTVDMGDHDLRTTRDTDHVSMSIRRTVSHKDFTTETMLCDIAILTFRYQIKFNDNIRPICLPSPTKSYAQVVGILAGWGRLAEGGDLPDVLQQVSLQVWSNRDCRIRFGEAAPVGILDSMLCAGGVKGQDSCSGDSGGPLMVKDGANWVVAGLVSWGYGCGQGHYPGVYTRVSSFLSWISKNM